jgi:hypothetical protein
VGETKVPGSDVVESDPVRTDLNCTYCQKNFIAQLDMGLDGNHIILCPYCSHEHCRVVNKGVVTGDRWDTREQRHDVSKECVWKSPNAPIVTSMASHFLRERWLNRVDVEL